MTRVETIEREIQNLSKEEFEELREWLLEKDWQRWDRQNEEDATTGKVEKLFKSSAQPTLKELLLAESPRAEIPVPARHRWRRRLRSGSEGEGVTPEGQGVTPEGQGVTPEGQGV